MNDNNYCYDNYFEEILKVLYDIKHELTSKKKTGLLEDLCSICDGKLNQKERDDMFMQIGQEVFVLWATKKYPFNE